MKAILFAGLVATAAAVSNANTCVIPGEYTLNAVGAACTGPNPAYLVTAECYNVDGTILAPVHPLTTAAADLLKFNSGAAAFGGCRVSGQDRAFGTDLSAGTGACPFLAGSPLINGAIKGIRVACAPGFFALPNTFTGALVCASGSAGTVYSAAAPGGVGTFINAFGAPNPLVLSGANRLQCVAGCVLPAPICNGATVNAGAIILDAAGNRLQPTNCLIAPGTTVSVLPVNFVTQANPTTYTCSPAGVLTVGPVANLIPLTGAIGCPWGEGVANTPRTMPAGGLSDFAAVTSTVTSGPVTAVPGLGSVSQQYISVAGCPVGTAGNLCVQEAIRYWRCRSYNVDSCTVCLNNGVRIPCPTRWNGFAHCPRDDGSKKGLLGLLGLLGIIPLCLCCLLLCCLLFPCCIRRKKTEGDVHFATFDPHAAPVAASVVPAPTAICAEPMMGHCVDPCAVPTACF